jgi:hypothetical protein
MVYILGALVSRVQKHLTVLLLVADQVLERV